MAGAIRPSTLDSYQGYAANYLKPYLGGKQIAQITPEDIQKLYRTLWERGRVREHPQYGKRLSDSTIRSVHAMLHQAMAAAEQAHLILQNPTEKVAVPKAALTQKRILNDEQLERFMEEIRKDALWHDFFYTELTTGLRRGEICGLRLEDFDEESGTLNNRRTVQRQKGVGLTARDTKTYAGTKKMILPPSTAQLLRERKVMAFSPWIFPDLLHPEQPTNPTAAYGRMKALLKQAGLPSIRFHDLRHTFATNALEHGMDIKTLSTIIGHVSSATTLNVYAHVTDDMKKDAAVKIDHGIAGAVMPKAMPKGPVHTTFQAKKGKYRKPGTGCISQINDRLWERRYSPRVNGKRMARNVYTHSEAECERLLAEMIAGMKAEIVAERERLKSEAKTS